MAYRLRGSLCEGVYEKQVGADSLWVVGFHMARTPFDEKTYGQVRLKIGTSVKGDPLPPSQLLLLVSSVAPQVYYGMDTDVSIGQSIDWNLEIVRRLHLTPEQIAIMACTNRCVQRDITTTYWPVDILRPGTSTGKEPPTLILQSGIEIRGAIINVIRRNGSRVRDHSIKIPHTPAGTPIPVSLAGLIEDGVNDVEVVGLPRGKVGSRVSWRGRLYMPSRL